MTGSKDSIWNPDEVWLLKVFYACGTPLSEMVDVFGRSKTAISNKAKRLFIKHGDEEALTALEDHDDNFSGLSDEATIEG